ncbi:MAG TPA: hypothetical protein DDW31_09220 [candidate division Zixibacteria bacterium]|nr:hypothetical protein [candidate division Zixibacteria bacterium]
MKSSRCTHSQSWTSSRSMFFMKCMNSSAVKPLWALDSSQSSTSGLSRLDSSSKRSPQQASTATRFLL